MSDRFTHFRKEQINYKNYLVTRFLPIKELNLTLIELVHKPTGANIVHLANDDCENVFCLSFSTYPSSSNGVAHILEHTVLCGSKKFVDGVIETLIEMGVDKKKIKIVGY